MGNSQTSDAGKGSRLTRRALLGDLAIAGAGLTAMPVFSACRGLVPGRHAVKVAAARSHGVVSFHMDQPYLDATGNAMPYYHPSGMRSGAPAEHLSEDAFRRIQYYV